MKQNLHTHTIFCDGKNTPEEMVKYALEKGFDSLGFSGHSYVPFDLDCCMNPEENELYKNEVRRLKEKYSGRLEIFLGTEYDILSDIDTKNYDYLIGSAHYFKFGDEYSAIDGKAESVKRLIDLRFGGDGIEFAKAYYELLSKLPEHRNFDILAHFDLVTKNIEQVFLFDPDSKEYLNYAFEAIASLAGRIPFFEVNTGAIARGRRTAPYPAIPLLKEFKRKGFGAVISSDCHNGEMLDCCFDTAEDILRECGFKERYVLTSNGFKAVGL